MKQRTLAPRLPLPDFDNKLGSSPTQSALRNNADSGKDIRLIPVSSIDPNPFAPREIYTDQMILDRAEDLRSQGQHDPIHVIQNPDIPDRFIICDGWTRVTACLRHHVMDALSAEVHHNLRLEDSAWFGYEQNEGREQQCDIDRAFFYEKMIRNGQPASEVAERARKSKSMMTYYRAYAKLPQELMELARSQPHKFGARVAYELARLCESAGTRKAFTLASRFADEDRPVRWLSLQVQAVLNPAQRQRVISEKEFRFSNGYYKQSGEDFKVSISVPAEQREVFANALEELVRTVAIEKAEKAAGDHE
jgi:ParB family chromosome partitioning protein